MPDMPSFRTLEEAPDWVRNYYRIRLDVELRSVRGEAFQRLFDRVMKSIHAKDYAETVALGSRGDEGCDGYLKSRRIVFACYGPDPYFRLAEATRKMATDLEVALRHWKVPSEMHEWIFVINYPGSHPSLIKKMQALASQAPGLTCRIWSRHDIIEQFLLWARRTALINEFGAVSSSARSAGRAFIVPETTGLPRMQAELSARLMRARLSCDVALHEKLLKKWFNSVATDPWLSLVAQTQMVISAIAAATMNGYLNPEKPPLKLIFFESEMRRKSAQRHALRAWKVAMGIINSTPVEGMPTVVPEVGDPIGEDFDKLISTIVAAQQLAMGIIRLYARRSGQPETICLDETWHYAVTIKIHDEG